MAKKKTTQEFAEEISKKWNLKLVGEYRSAHSTVEFLCVNGHQNSASATNLLGRGYKCKECITGYRVTPRTDWTSEKLQLLKQMFDKGMDVEVIAQQLSTTKPSVYRIISDQKWVRSSYMHHFSEILETLKRQDRELLTPLDNRTEGDTLLTIRCANNHTIQQRVINIATNRSGCLDCLHMDSYQHQFHEILQTLKDQERELLTPLDENTRSKTLLKIRCKHNHEVEQRAEALVDGKHNCLHCFNTNSFQHRFPEILETLKVQNRELLSSLDQNTRGTTLLTIKCKNNHTVEQLTSNIANKKYNCPHCSNPRSHGEQELLEYVRSLYPGWIIENDRSILEGQELDIVLPDRGLAFEYNGAYWHSSDKKPRHYHQQKTKSIQEFGYQLIHIHEYQWQYNQQLVKQKIRHLLQPQPRIGARKTCLEEVTWQEAKRFLEQTHIQGAGAPTGYNFGLYYQDRLVALATFSKPRFNHNYEMELVRYSSSQPVQGGCSRLLAHAQKTLGFQNLVTYALCDWSQGNLYKTLGFELQGLTEPNYSYYKNTQRLTRYQAQKHRLAKILDNYDSNQTEVENMQANGYHQVFDSGNQVWTKGY